MTTENECPGAAQAVGWALHALEPDEEMSVALHVPGCLVCQTAVRETEEVVAGLGFTADQVEPPAGLRTSIMSAVVETPQNVPVRTGLPPEVEPAVVPARPRPRHSAPRPVGRAQQPATWLTRRRLVVAAVALVAVVAVGGLAVRTAQLEQVRTQQSEAISELVDTLVPAGSRHAVLATADGATVGAVVLENGERKLLTVGMATNSETTSTYVLWGLKGQSAPVALSTFDVTTTDPDLRAVGSTPVNEGYTAYAVSIENGRVAPPAPSAVMAKGLLV